MFPWSNKINRSVTFSQDLADQDLLAAVESQLVQQPHKTFSDLCKDALSQVLGASESVGTDVSTGSLEQQVAEMQQQLADLEQRFFAKESSRIEAMERQVNQLSLQLAQLSVALHHPPGSQSFPQPAPAAEPALPPPPPIDDPLLNRLSPLLDDF
ncbi:MAG: hypothetical protein KME06_19135 [Kastovskya adunca ATA6-11-RM4]|jgi:hypothetical protein|nr:hypothetical protein [Kastovskya adunca ATA6-11-RM4]